MKLNKAICKRCRNKAFAAGRSPKWNELNEVDWQCRVVWCPVSLLPSFPQGKASYYGQSIDEMPHQNCPYIVEHIVLYASPD